MNTPFSIKNVAGLYQVMCGIVDYYKRICEPILREIVLEHIRSFIIKCLTGLREMPASVNTDELSTKICELAKSIGLVNLGSVLAKYEKIIFYGGGRRCDFLLESYPNPDEIWDINAETIRFLNDIRIKKPDFDSLQNHANWLLMVCVDDIAIWISIKKKCTKLGFQNAYNWRSFYYY